MKASRSRTGAFIFQRQTLACPPSSDFCPLADLPTGRNSPITGRDSPIVSALGVAGSILVVTGLVLGFTLHIGFLAAIIVADTLGIGRHLQLDARAAGVAAAAVAAWRRAPLIGVIVVAAAVTAVLRAT